MNPSNMGTESAQVHQAQDAAQRASTILTAALDINNFGHYVLPQTQTGCNGGAAFPLCFTTSPPLTTHSTLSALALMRSSQALANLRLANLHANAFYGMPPNNQALLLASSNFDFAIKAATEQAQMSQQACGSMPGTTDNNMHAPPVRSLSLSSASQTSVLKERNDDALETLGATPLERRKRKSPYFDASTLHDPDVITVANRRTRGGVTEPFPDKLYRMLMEARKEGKEDVISFFPHGRSFGIHKPERFAQEIMPKYFKQSRVSSFQRQLNLYGFSRINTGPDAGGYYHELFLKGRPALSVHIRRVGVPQAVPRRRGVKAHDATVDPDFYNMPAIADAKEDV